MGVTIYPSKKYTTLVNEEIHEKKVAYIPKKW